VQIYVDYDLGLCAVTRVQRRMSSDMSPSLVNWMTSMMTMRLQVVLEHLPLTSSNIQQYIVPTQVLSSTLQTSGPDKVILSTH